MAPYANIIFVHRPVPETIGMQGWPQVAQAIKMIADQHLADIVTVTWRRRERFHQRPDQPDRKPAGGYPLAGSRVPRRRRAQHPGDVRLR